MVNIFTKLIYLHVVKSVTAVNLATAVWWCWCTYGHTDLIVSDMGLDLKSALLAELVKLTGIRQVFSIANQHVNGCEQTAKEVARHVRAIVFDERMGQDCVLDNELTLPTLLYVLNTHASSETGHTQFELTFGSQDVIYKDLLAAQGKDSGPTHLLLKRLKDNLALIRQISLDYQRSLVAARAEKGIDPVKQNQYYSGDFDMFDAGSKPHPKLSSRMKGPFEVVRQYKNDVLIRNLVPGGMREYSVSDLEPCYSHKATAVEAAMRDQEQFKVKYADGDMLDIPRTPDLQCEAYYVFCESRPYLMHLIFD